MASFYQAAKKFDLKPNILKKSNRYTSITIQSIVLKDVLQFTSPTSLSKFLKQWNASEEKGVFPYECYQKVEQLYTTEFPAYEKFYSSIKQANISLEEYNQAKQLFEYRTSLPRENPDRWRFMVDYLRWYNLLDVRPLVEALENCFDSFHRHFGVDPLSSVSLPSLAFQAMFSMFDKSMPYGYSFNEKFDDVRQLFRQNVIGGLTTVTHRHINLEDDTGPHNARIAPNGNKFTSVSFWDFNSMYLWSQRQDMPLTPGLLWEPNGSKFTKKVMKHGVSLPHLQWLYWLQETDFCIDSNGQRQQIQHDYHRGEKRHGKYRIDGYLEIDGQEVFLEFLGKLTGNYC